ncbi:Aspartate--tRNA(Asp/Asn) ligase [uncultured archaeon]|nr:Aspartate--tRNA(Asp/Asn) ligase [uncultured archaeon]
MVKEKKSKEVSNYDIDTTKRTYIKDAFSKSGEIELYGWVHDTRDLSKIRFLVLRDITGRLQVVGIKGETSDDIFEKMHDVSRESVVKIKGTLKDSKQAPGGKELNPTEIEIISVAEQPLPIDVSDHSKTELPKRLDFRFLDLHRERAQAIFKVNNTLLQAYREFMEKEGAFEAIFPSIIGASSEGGTEVYPVQYFEKKALLSQSCQLYKQMLACSMEKVYAVFPVWRAEKHNTIRHLNESRQYDFEMAFADDKIVMDVLARCVQHMVKKVLEKHSKELEMYDVKIKVPDVKYLTFHEVAELMKKHNCHVGKDDLSPESERKLGELYPDTIVFVHDWPLSGKPFYIMPSDKKGPNGEQLSKGFDAIYKGMEISSGGQRIHIPELLTQRFKAKGMKVENFKDYIDSFRYGAPIHAGWGMGVERMTMLILGLPNIREAVLFPRDRDRLTP